MTALDAPPLEERLNLLRQSHPAVTARVYLNTGTAGPLATSTHERLTEALASELRTGRADLRTYRELEERLVLLRDGFASLLNADRDEVAIVRHTTDGINAVAWGLPFRAGDEIVTTTHEHAGAYAPLYAVAARAGLGLRMVDLGLGSDPARCADRVAQAITPRTRLVVVSHVLWTTGGRIPLSPIVEAAHRKGALVLVDGAQSVGAIAVDVRALGVDAYTVSGQKWLCGPEEVGALYVRRDRIAMIRPTFVGYGSLDGPASYSVTGDFMPAKGARRYEVGTIFRPKIVAMIEALRVLREGVTSDAAFARISDLAAYAKRALGAVPRIYVLTPDTFGGLITFRHETKPASEILRALTADNFILRTVPLPSYEALRISTGWYNTREEIDRLCASLSSLS